MKCPYRLITTEREIKPIEVPEQSVGVSSTGITTSVVTITKIVSEEFAECLGNECPFHDVYADKEECMKASAET